MLIRVLTFILNVQGPACGPPGFPRDRSPWFPQPPPDSPASHPAKFAKAEFVKAKFAKAKFAKAKFAKATIAKAKLAKAKFAKAKCVESLS